METGNLKEMMDLSVTGLSIMYVLGLAAVGAIHVLSSTMPEQLVIGNVGIEKMIGMIGVMAAIVFGGKFVRCFPRFAGKTRWLGLVFVVVGLLATIAFIIVTGLMFWSFQSVYVTEFLGLLTVLFVLSVSSEQLTAEEES